MLRWISSVPPAIDMPGTDRAIWANRPSAGACGPVELAARAERSQDEVAVGAHEADRGELAEGDLGAGEVSGAGGGSGAQRREPPDLRPRVQPRRLLAQHRIAVATGRPQDVDEHAPRLAGGGHRAARAVVDLAAGVAADRQVQVERVLDAGRRLGLERVPLVGQQAQGHAPPLVHVADHVLDGHDGVGEEHLVELGVARHLDEGPGLDTGLVHLDHEEREPAVLRDGRVGPGDEDGPPGVVPARGPHLLAVHDPLVTVAHGAGWRGRPGRTRRPAR